MTAETDGGGRLALTGRRRRYRRHQNQFAVISSRVGINEISADFGLVMTIGNHRVRGDAQFCSYFDNRPNIRRLCDFDITFHRHDSPLLLVVSWPRIL